MNVLFKYYSNKFDIIDHLKNPAIKLAPTMHFNDPFESTLCEQLATKLSQGLNPTEKEKDNDPFFDFYKDVYTNIPKNYGVVSLTENHRNILMWAHYATSHQGFCIGYKKDFIAKKFQASKVDELLGVTNPLPQRVIYDSRRFDINKFNDATNENKIPYDFIMEKMLIKSNEWIYEKEHRCIIPFQYGESIKVIGEPTLETENIIYKNLNKKSIKKINESNEYSFDIVPKIIHNSSIHELAQQDQIIILKSISIESIDSIYFGCQCCESKINKTLKILNNDNYRHIKAYRYKINNDTFDIDEERIF